jgi:hypothetical protein
MTEATEKMVHRLPVVLGIGDDELSDGVGGA